MRECFSYKGGCDIYASEHLKEKLAWAIDKWFGFLAIMSY